MSRSFGMKAPISTITKSRGLTVWQVAAGTKIYHRTLTDYYRNFYPIQPAHVQTLCEFFQCSPDDLVPSTRPTFPSIQYYQQYYNANKKRGTKWDSDDWSDTAWERYQATLTSPKNKGEQMRLSSMGKGLWDYSVPAGGLPPTPARSTPKRRASPIGPPSAGRQESSYAAS